MGRRRIVSIGRKDYILRMIEQLTEAIARVVGLKEAGKLDEALQLARETAGGIFGPLLRTLDEVDSATAANLMGDGDKVSAYAALLAEQADIHERRGDARRARADHRRALEMYLERARLAPPLDDRARAAIEALRAKVDETRLAERYRSALRAVQ
jgi:hypothetical protein